MTSDSIIDSSAEVIRTPNGYCPMAVSQISNIQQLSPDDYITEQSKDEECRAAKLYLESGKKNFDVSTLGSLKRYRKHLHIVQDVLKWKNKYVVPHSLRKSILELCHDHPMSGHFAIERTHQRFKNNYFWPGAPTDVLNYVNNCQKCNEFNPPRNQYIKVPLQPIETSCRFEMVCYDIAGPFLPKTVRGNCYVLIIVDHFTHWPEFVALTDTTAPTIATALFDNWCCRYGTPYRFHSDGANNVHGEVVKELCKNFGMQKSKSSRLHPQGDGMAEIYVKQLKSCVQKQVEKNGENWDLFLQATAFAIRSNIAYNTKVSPAELIFGEKLTQPIDNIMSDKPRTFNQKQGSEFAQELKSRIQSSTKIVNEHLLKSREQMKKAYDKDTTFSPFSVGDTVMLWKPYKRKGISGCFQPKWHGPWKILKFTGRSNSNCKIVECGKPTNKLNVHVNQLKLVKDYEKIHTQHNTKQYINNNRLNNNNKLNKTKSCPTSQSGGMDNVDPFLHYLDDFEDEDVQLERPVQPVQGHPQINEAWVAIDVNNIIPGGRVRNRLDYNVLAGNS